MPCSRGYLRRKSLDFQKQKTEEKQMKNIAKYGIVLLSVAVLGAATTIPMSVSANETPNTNAKAKVEEVSRVKVGIFYGNNYSTPIKEWVVELNKGESYTAQAPTIEGYTFKGGVHFDGIRIREFTQSEYTVQYATLKGAALDQTISFLYEPEKPAEPQKPAEPEKPAPNPGQPETPTPTPAQTQKFKINYWALRGGEGGTSLGTETVEVSPGETYTVQKKDFPGYEFQGASIDNGATGIDVELPYNLKYGDKNQGIDLIYKKKSQKPAEPEKPADPEKPAPNPGQPETPIPAPTPTPTPQPTPNPSDNGNNSNQGNKLNPSDNKPSDNGNGKSENPTDNQNPAKNGNDSTPSDNGEKQNNSNQGDNNRDTTKQSEINKSNETTKNKLPNTGEAVSSLGFLGVGLLSSLGLTKKRYKGRHERH